MLPVTDVWDQKDASVILKKKNIKTKLSNHSNPRGSEMKPDHLPSDPSAGFLEVSVERETRWSPGPPAQR